MYNAELAAKMKSLYLEAQELYKEFISNGKTGPKTQDLQVVPRDFALRESTLWFISGYEEQIAAVPGFVECVRIMEATDAISCHFDKMVGTAENQSRVPDSSRIILEFLFHTLSAPESDFFDTNYEQFEKFFYEDCLVVTDRVRLHRFESTVPVIELADTLRIIKDDLSEYDERYPKDFKFRSGDYSNFVIVTSTKAKKYIRTPKHLPISGEAEEPENSVQFAESEVELSVTEGMFDRVIKSLRLLKESGVGLDEEID